MFSEVMRYILDLGPTVMLPVVIIIFSKILGMKAGDCFKAGLHIGIGFVGFGLVGDAANLLFLCMMVFLRCSSGFCFYQLSLLFSY